MAKSKQAVSVLVISCLGIAPMTGCGLSNTAKGALIGVGGGGAAGAAIGGAIGRDGKSAAIGAIIGAAVGGTVGALIGRQMDKRAEEIRKDLEGAKVERVGEGILVTFDSGILFDTGKSDLKSAARENVQQLSAVLKKYDDTDVMIVGHTDSTGSDDLNARLSKERADSVAGLARSLGVAPNRIKILGEGSTKPVGDNTTSTGRQANRRVEVAIFANDKMKKAIN